MYAIPASSVVGIDTTGYGLSITRIKAEIIASWQSKYKTSIRNQITMAAVAGQGEGKEGAGRAVVEGAFSTLWLPSITPPSWPVGVAVFNMQTNGQKNVYPHAHTYTHTHTEGTHVHTLADCRATLKAEVYRGI